MKKLIMSLALIFFSTVSSYACDICGCGVGSYYLGILPEFNKRFLGLRYQYKNLHTHLGPNGERTPITADENYQSTELWGGWNLGKRFRVLAFVPYNFNRRSNQEGNGTKNGLGDVAVMGYYKVFEQIGTVKDRLMIQSLWIGGGIKVPTGNYEPAERLAVQESPNNFQLGTASTDFTLTAAYDIRYNDMGLNANVSYKMNTENKYNYKYGNKFTSNVLAYYKFRVAKVLTIAPNTGILYETAKKDLEDKKYTVDVSGGYSLSAIAGLELAFKGMSLGTNYQNVRSQDLAGGRAYAGNRVMVHTSVSF
ncbi:transporter [Pedobacter sp. MC2016-14]|uniref:transporter n=1 Tax=Pedobacter sp. MC2016-14 TaxID=2897327 RepID=UPI001E511435|nr:transporter [Pedobacter sp. MC2016-14]MCD0490252.1 transporter [Pedobacter sp. MC2016-14]